MTETGSAAGARPPGYSRRLSCPHAPLAIIQRIWPEGKRGPRAISRSCSCTTNGKCPAHLPRVCRPLAPTTTRSSVVSPQPPGTCQTTKRLWYGPGGGQCCVKVRQWGRNYFLSWRWSPDQRPCSGRMAAGWMPAAMVRPKLSDFATALAGDAHQGPLDAGHHSVYHRCVWHGDLFVPNGGHTARATRGG